MTETEPSFYVVTVNQPGYMPEEGMAELASAGDVIEALEAQLQRTADAHDLPEPMLEAAKAAMWDGFSRREGYVRVDLGGYAHEARRMPVSELVALGYGDELAEMAELTTFELECLKAGDKAPGQASETQRGAYRRALRKLAEVA